MSPTRAATRPRAPTITIANLDRMVMPSVLEVKYADGSATRIALPAETWILRGRTKVTVPGGGPIADGHHRSRPRRPRQGPFEQRFHAEGAGRGAETLTMDVSCDLRS